MLDHLLNAKNRRSITQTDIVIHWVTLLRQMVPDVPDLAGLQFGPELAAPRKDVADDTLKLLVRDNSGHVRAVAVCASPAAPDVPSELAALIQSAREALGPIDCRKL